MKIPLLLCAAALLAGCLTDDKKLDGTVNIDPFPKPIGAKIVPLEDSGFQADYRYVEFDSAGAVKQRIASLPLYVRRRGPNLYGYSFEGTDRGLLLEWRDGQKASPLPADPRDSAGVYIVGAFQDSVNVFDSAATLWILQFPKPGVPWASGPRTVELVDGHARYLTEKLFDNDTVATLRYGFQQHPAVLMRETRGDTVTHYYFRPGVGMLGFDRAVSGRLLATGTLRRFLALPTHPPWY